MTGPDGANRIEVLAADRPIREVNDEIRAALADGREVLVRDARSRHNLGVGLPAAARVRFEGSVGYYCGGLNDGASIEIERNAGWGVGEAMARGEIVVGGYAGHGGRRVHAGRGAPHSRRRGAALRGGDEGRRHHRRGPDRLPLRLHGPRRPAHRPRRGRRGLRRLALGRRGVARGSGAIARRRRPPRGARRPRRSSRSRRSSPRAGSGTPAATGARSCRSSGCGTSRAGTPRPG